VTGIVTNQATNDEEEENNHHHNILQQDDDDDHNPNTFSNGWKINIILACVSCFVAMSLTGWGSIQTSVQGIGGTAANPMANTASMWIVIASQWIGLLLYVWTLVAPKLFPHRDFGN